MLAATGKINDTFESCSWYEKNLIRDRHIIPTAQQCW
jgi:hypothetical protein